MNLPVPSRKEAKVTVAREVMLDFLLLYVGASANSDRLKDIYGFWDPQLSKLFLEKNKSGRFDQAFNDIKFKIAKQRNPKGVIPEGSTIRIGMFGAMRSTPLPEDLEQIQKVIDKRRASKDESVEYLQEKLIALQPNADFRIPAAAATL